MNPLTVSNALDMHMHADAIDQWVLVSKLATELSVSTLKLTASKRRVMTHLDQGDVPKLPAAAVGPISSWVDDSLLA